MSASNAVEHSMRNRIMGAVLVSLLALAPNMARADASSTPGKFAAAVSQSEVDLLQGGTVSGQLEKGKKKRILKITGRTDPEGMHGYLRSYITVNGIAVEPLEGLYGDQAATYCTGGYPCLINATWWLDLDAAEAAHPGMFINVPLNVVMTAYASVLVQGRMSLMAELIKK